MGLLGSNNYPVDRAKTYAFTMYDLCKYIMTYYKTLWWDFGLSLHDLCNKIDYPVSKLQMIDESMNLVFVMPEIQPRLNNFQASNIKFVGPCVDENVRKNISSQKINMEKYIQIIDEFLSKNLSINALTLTNNNKLASFVSQSSMSDEQVKQLYKPIIYVSMGTVFNNENSHLFQVLVEACKFFSREYAVIVSTGDEKAYEKYANSPLNSDTILLIPHTPQVEILKIANLFITHAGMNSVSEAINYGVPIICLPLSGDQPFVAWRVADELGMGIRLQPDVSLTVFYTRQSRV
jgi:UDP:flavonoid glycosyltransferase YjiC (YdhE family)